MKKCHITHEFLEIKGLFFRVYERCDKFRQVIKKASQCKNNITHDLSSCVVQNFNESEVLKVQLKIEKKRCHEPIDIIYEPVNDERSIECFFTSNLHLAYRSIVLKR